MYRIKEIQEKLLHVVGWEQSYNPNEAINESLTETTSGLYFQGAHPLLTLNNIKSIIPEDFTFIYPNWSNTIAYKAGNKVNNNSKIYIAKRDNTNVTPVDTLNDDWALYNYVSDYLERETKSGIAAMVTTFIQNKQLDRETKSLLERRTFFDGAGRLAATIDNRSKIVGYEIVPVRSMGVTTKIERIGLQTTGAIGTVKLYIFHSSKVEPLYTIDVEITDTKGGFKWFPVTDVYLPYTSVNNGSGGSWFLCYNQNELPAGMDAINISKDWSREPCMSCNMGDIQQWRELTKYIQISPFMRNAPQDFTQYPEMWDIAENLYTNTVNYGLNVEISVGCDLTDFIISQSDLFKSVIQKQVAVNLLRKIAMNPDVRANRNQSNVSRMDVLYEIDGNTNGVRPSGLGYELQKAYKALKFDTQGIDRICLTCNNNGVTYRTV